MKRLRLNYHGVSEMFICDSIDMFWLCVEDMRKIFPISKGCRAIEIEIGPEGVDYIEDLYDARYLYINKPYQFRVNGRETVEVGGLTYLAIRRLYKKYGNRFTIYEVL